MTSLARDQISQVTLTIEWVETSPTRRTNKTELSLSLPQRLSHLTPARVVSDEASSVFLWSENFKCGDTSQKKTFGVVGLCWNKTKVKDPEDPFHQFLYF